MSNGNRRMAPTAPTATVFLTPPIREYNAFMKKPTRVLRGFDELQRLRSTTAAAPGQAEPNPESLVEDLRRLRIDFAAHLGLQPHHFSNAVAHRRERFQELGDALFAERSVESWKIRPSVAALVTAVASEISACNSLIAARVIEPVVLEFSIDGARFPELPSGYCFKGGVARKALAHALFLNACVTSVRDIDVVCFGARNRETDTIVAKSFMQDDWLVAKNPERVIDLQNSTKGYFRTREFTINEVFLSGSRLQATAQCVCDLLGGVVRPTAHHLRINRGNVVGIVAAKAVRFYVEGRHEGREMRLDPFTVRGRTIRNFDLALHFARAREKGDAVALAYLEELRRRKLTTFRPENLIPATIRRLAKLIRQPESFFNA